MDTARPFSKIVLDIQQLYAEEEAARALNDISRHRECLSNLIISLNACIKPEHFKNVDISSLQDYVLQREETLLMAWLQDMLEEFKNTVNIINNDVTTKIQISDNDIKQEMLEEFKNTANIINNDVTTKIQISDNDIKDFEAILAETLSTPEQVQTGSVDRTHATASWDNSSRWPIDGGCEEGTASHQTSQRYYPQGYYHQDVYPQHSGAECYNSAQQQSNYYGYNSWQQPQQQSNYIGYNATS